MYTHVLLATERTEFDAGAERVALALARRDGVRLSVVIPLVSNAEYQAAAPEFAAREERDARAKLETLRAEARNAAVDLDGRVVPTEEPYRAIVAEASRLGADLVIARRRGKRGFLANLLVGDLVGRVATLAPCDVLLVPRVGALWSNRVLAAVDPSAAAVPIAAAAARLGAAFGLPVTLAGAALPARQDQRAAAEAAVAAALRTAADAGAAVDGRVVDGEASEAVLALAAETHADLIVIGRARNTGRLAQDALGKIGHRIAGGATCPVLVVRTA